LENVKETIRFEAAKKSVVKVSLVYICQMSMTDFAGEKGSDNTDYHFEATLLSPTALKRSGLSAKITKAFENREHALDEFCDSGSNWTFDRAVAFDIGTVCCETSGSRLCFGRRQ